MTTSIPPAFQMYPNDFLGSGKVAAMSLEEAGAYTLLLCYDWNEVGLPNDSKILARWIRVSERKFEKIWVKIRGNFALKSGRWYNPRLEREREKQAANRKKKHDAANARWHPNDADAMQVHDAGALHMECSPSAVAAASPSPRGTKTTATTASGVSPDELCRQLITAANKGMAENPAIGNAINPIPFGHGPSHQAAVAIHDAGVDAAFAASVVFEVASSMKPTGRNRQLNSLGYCTARVIDRWEREAALSTANGASRPAIRPRSSSPRTARVSVAEQGYANAKIGLEGYPDD